MTAQTVVHAYLRCQPCDVVWKSTFDLDCWVCGQPGTNGHAPVITSQWSMHSAELARSARTGVPMPDRIILDVQEGSAP